MNKSNMRSENIIAFLVFVLLIIYPMIASNYGLLNMTYYLAMGFLTISVVLIWGYTGLFSFGQTAFFGLGGYAYAIITLNFSNSPEITPLALLITVVISGLAGLILGYFMFYGGVNDVFVGLITLCVTLVLSTFMAQTAGSEWKMGSVPLGGFNGINNIPTISLGYGETLYTFSYGSFYYLVLVMLIITYVIIKRLKTSKWGYSLIAIRENRDRSSLFGYNVPLIQTISFALGAALAALSGVLYAIWGGYITPSVMDISAASLPVVLAAAAGRKNITAVIIFTIIYFWFSQYLSAGGSEYALVILGFILVITILLVPQGLIAQLFDVLDQLFGKIFLGKKRGEDK